MGNSSRGSVMVWGPKHTFYSPHCVILLSAIHTGSPKLDKWKNVASSDESWSLDNKADFDWYSQVKISYLNPHMWGKTAYKQNIIIKFLWPPPLQKQPENVSCLNHLVVPVYEQ